jgi:hypothetical protein
MQIDSVGIDLGKTTFHVVALGAAGKVLVRKKLTRNQLLAYTTNMSGSLIGLEACAGAHFLGGALRKQGQDVRLIRPRDKSHKTPFREGLQLGDGEQPGFDGRPDGDFGRMLGCQPDGKPRRFWVGTACSRYPLRPTPLRDSIAGR